MKTPEEILTHFPICAASVELLTFGHIHKTWKVSADLDYILQWVNPIFSILVMQDIAAVTEHLTKKGVRTFEVIHTKEDNLYVPDEQGFWRMFSYIPGDVFASTSSPEIVYAAGKMLGEFHVALADCAHVFQHARTLHRDTQTLFSLYRETMNRAGDVFDEDLTKALVVLNDIPDLLLPVSLKAHVTHGDPKLSNMIFSKTSPVAGVALVDLDDCSSRYNVLVDIGDALRSWCQGKEDDFKTGLSFSLYRSGVSGYLEGSGTLLTPEEKKLIPQATKLITLELACRFARDIVEDNYFGWNGELYASRKEHNRARVLAQVALYKDLVEADDELQRDL